MIKTGLYIILLIGLHRAGLSQNSQPTPVPGTTKTDSLKHKLALVTNDSDRITMMSLIGFYYEVVNVDSSMKYTNDALSLARTRGFTWAEPGLMNNLASVLRQQGKLAESIDLLFRSLKIAEANNLFAEIGRANRRLSDVYIDLDNYPKGLEYLLQALKIDEAHKIKSGTVVDQMSLGYAYGLVNKLDSASYYTDLAFKQKDVVKNWMQYIYQAYGNIELKMQNYDQAASFFRLGIANAQQNNDLKTTSAISNDLATLFVKRNKKDSAFYYASMAFDYGQRSTSNKGVMLSGNLLAALYDSVQPATALKYYKIAAVAKDSLFGINNIETIQNLVSREASRQKELEAARISYRNRLKLYGALTGLIVLFVIAFILLRNNRQKQQANTLLQKQKEKVETTLVELKSTQAQLIQAEKMASLGQLTAGIAHEIQNPLNFVNNFSDINAELLNEAAIENEKGNRKEVELILNDLKENEQKIIHHGQRAAAIVKGMLEHSSSRAGHKEPTDINTLADEYLRLAYHGFSGKDGAFKVTMKTDFDETIGNINIIPQDIGKVLMNLYNNAFYAVASPTSNGGIPDPDKNYNPTLWVNTKKVGDKIFISVRDNGGGIPQNIVDKIFQPFFTTKPTGSGTGLGLSLAYDIVKAHGGVINVESKQYAGSTFIVELPIKNS